MHQLLAIFSFRYLSWVGFVDWIEYSKMMKLHHNYVEKVEGFHYYLLYESSTCNQHWTENKKELKNN